MEQHNGADSPTLRPPPGFGKFCAMRKSPTGPRDSESQEAIEWIAGLASFMKQVKLETTSRCWPGIRLWPRGLVTGDGCQQQHAVGELWLTRPLRLNICAHHHLRLRIAARQSLHSMGKAATHARHTGQPWTRAYPQDYHKYPLCFSAKSLFSLSLFLTLSRSQNTEKS
ncbi:hypothetical protein L209DRAFT_375347 [Thermothelomyces heterothallicus CBS 203.75]